MNKITFTLLVGLIACGNGRAKAAKVDTLTTYSDAMRKDIPALVVKPDNYSAQRKYPVVYLLHGYSGDYTGWMKINGEYIRKMADREDLLIVSADGGFSSWYFDVEGDSACQYETYIAKELIDTIDRLYATVRSPEGRGITGLSMGGHGALYLAFRHPDVFSVAGSMSGGLDIRSFPKNWDLEKRLGSYAEQPDKWDQHTVAGLTHLLVPGQLRIIIDCGTEDFFYTVNSKLHERLLERNIPHEFISRPGKHDSAYWSHAIMYQLLFMAEQFHRFQADGK
jgi:S-formylglutathione hydrolase FrmB